MNIQPLAKVQATAALLVAAATIVFAGCSGGGSSTLNSGCASYGGGGGGGGNCVGHPNPSPTQTVPPATAPVGILLTNENPVTTSSFSTVLGYFNGTTTHTPNSSGVVNLTAATSVQFVNLESNGTPHTASFLGAWSGSYPSNGPTSAALTPSPAGTAIGTAGFSAGMLNAASSSLVYSSGAPGMYVFGCFYHYGLGMRTVIIVT